MRHLVFWICATTFSLCIVFAFCELTIRTVIFTKERSTQVPRGMYPLTKDDQIGWVQTPNYHWSGIKTDANGIRYAVTISTDQHGFRLFGTTNDPHAIRALVLGDSFTQALDVSNEHTYYAALSRLLPLNVFAYGAGGYGTLQEGMILNRYLDTISPDVVIIQFCSNDFINNSYKLERLSTHNNNRMRRPYLTDTGIVYHTPILTPGHSQMLNALTTRLDKLAARYLPSIETAIASDSTMPLFQDSVHLTAKIFTQIRTRVPATTPIYAFSSDIQSPFYDEFRKVCTRSGMIVLDDVPHALDAAQRQGVTITAADHAHWNQTGHQLVAEAIAKTLQNYFVKIY